jgi:hypothetical protein
VAYEVSCHISSKNYMLNLYIPIKCMNNVYTEYILCTYKVHTKPIIYIMCSYCAHTMYILIQSCKYAEFLGFHHDEDMQAGGPVSTQPHVTDDDAGEDMQAGGPVLTQPHVTEDDAGDDNPCSEDDEFFQGRPGAEDIEAAITKILDGLEGQERSGLKDLHRFLVRLPCPDVKKAGCSMSHSEAVVGGFIPTMNEEEQKRFTP